MWYWLEYCLAAILGHTQPEEQKMLTLAALEAKRLVSP
jgi:hypothetical protein